MSWRHHQLWRHNRITDAQSIIFGPKSWWRHHMCIKFWILDIFRFKIIFGQKKCHIFDDVITFYLEFSCASVTLIMTSERPMTSPHLHKFAYSRWNYHILPSCNIWAHWDDVIMTFLPNKNFSYIFSIIFYLLSTFDPYPCRPKGQMWSDFFWLCY